MKKLKKIDLKGIKEYNVGVKYGYFNKKGGKDMKSKLAKRIMLIIGISIIMLTLIQTFSFATNEKIQMIKKSENEYMIYVSDLLKEKFEFAFSNSKEMNKNDLKFYNSAKDQLENGNDIAYIDAEIYEKYIKGKQNIYLWIKQNDAYKLESEVINIEEVLTEEEIQDLNNVTKKIKVSFGEKELPEEIKDGVKITRKIGTINITDNKDSKYSYILMKSENGTDVEKLITLAENINKLENKNIYEKLSLYNEFKVTYNKLQPAIKDKKWTNVKNGIIEQPKDAKGNEERKDQYLVWIKQENKDNEIIDVQIMTCKNKEIPKYEDKKEIVKKTTKLPITGDNIALFVIAGIILSLIIILVVLKLKNKKKENK